MLSPQEIRRSQQQLHQGEAAFFAAAQDADRLEDVVAPEQEGSEQGADRLFGDARDPVAGLLEHGALQVEHLGAVLGKVTDRKPVARCHAARIQGEHPGKNLEQG